MIYMRRIGVEYLSWYLQWKTRLRYEDITPWTYVTTLSISDESITTKSVKITIYLRHMSDVWH